MIEVDIIKSTKVHLENYQQGLVQVVEDNNLLKEVEAFTIAEFLQH